QATSQERKIPVVSLASTKGGVGKTTLAYVLATEVARRLAHATSGGSSPLRSVSANASAPVWRGRVTCIDADPNRTLAQVLQLTKDRLITCIESDSERLLADLRNAQAEADLIVIDLEGTANQAMLYAAGKSDLVLVPAQPSRFDVVEAVKTVGVVRKAADLVGRDIAHRVVLSRTPVLRQRVADHSRAQFERAELPLLPVELVQRAAFQSMTYTGQPPWRQDGGEQAAANVASLVDEVLNIVGLNLPPVTRQDPQNAEGAPALRRDSWPHLQDVQTVA
ncbi:MAG TPA: ParA family protein, partial [Acetobacteraceae bacterium]|nr:ParA family protein [Acetobacteraceae bacterium]